MSLTRDWRRCSGVCHPENPLARAAGFSHDGNAAALIRNALNPATPRHWCSRDNLYVAINPA
jgi:hypothetical protein